MSSSRQPGRGRSPRRRRPAWSPAREELHDAREAPVAPRHPRCHQLARAARPAAPHAARHRAALRRRQGARRRPHDDLRGRARRQPEDPPADEAPAAAQEAPRGRAAFRHEEERRERLASELQKARLTGVRFKVPAESMSAKLANLPDGVSVERGRVEVRFDGAEDALVRLYTLAQALGNDLGRFQALVGRRGRGRPRRPRRGLGHGRLFSRAPGGHNPRLWVGGTPADGRQSRMGASATVRVQHGPRKAGRFDAGHSSRQRQRAGLVLLALAEEHRALRAWLRRPCAVRGQGVPHPARHQPAYGVRPAPVPLGDVGRKPPPAAAAAGAGRAPLVGRAQGGPRSSDGRGSGGRRLRALAELAQPDQGDQATPAAN